VLKILGARYSEQDMFHELLVPCHIFSVGKATWEAFSGIAVDVPEMVTKFMESHDDPDVVSKIRSL
jgi:hypothetical protein